MENRSQTLARGYLILIELPHERLSTVVKLLHRIARSPELEERLLAEAGEEDLDRSPDIGGSADVPLQEWSELGE